MRATRFALLAAVSNRPAAVRAKEIYDGLTLAEPPKAKAGSPRVA
jgi:hypothetical protein